MALVEWNSKLVIGIPFVDSDHKVLVSLLNQVHDCVEENEETAMLGSVLNALVDYTVYHFAREEKLQKLCGYSGLEAHSAVHGSLSEQVLEFRRRFNENAESVALGEVREFLSGWLIDHIMGHDFAYREACIGNRAAISEAGAIGLVAGGPESGPAVLDWRALKVLVIDDNPNFRLLLRTILKAAGVRLLQLAASADEGIDRLIKRPVDIVLCDWVMDGMDGAEFIRNIRQMNLPARVVLVTGNSVDTHSRQATDAGADGFLEKPISVGSLLGKISGALAGVALA